MYKVHINLLNEFAQIIRLAKFNFRHTVSFYMFETQKNLPAYIFHIPPPAYCHCSTLAAYLYRENKILYDIHICMSHDESQVQKWAHTI